MRSSVACARCRRSKIKCINNGIDTVCVPCHQNNRECTYPPPSTASSSSAKRSEHPSFVKGEGDGEVKRKKVDTGGKQMYRSGEDPLEIHRITLKLWNEIYTVFSLHYSTDLPFLHGPTFFARITEMQETGRKSREIQLFLLGILSLTARFIPELVSHHYPSDATNYSNLRPGDPLTASEYYAHALETRLDAITMATPSLDIIQALLMLGLHNWGMCRGMRSWMAVRAATSLAYAMGLSSEEDIDIVGKPDSVSSEEVERLGVKRKNLRPEAKLDTEAFVSREAKRRTMWSCFIIDRYLSSGRARPQMDIKTLHVQLPCSADDFRLGTNVKTGFLRPSTDNTQEDNSPRHGQLVKLDTDSALSIYIRLVEIWGRFSKWSCAGGRRQEKFPPWDERTEFFKLRRQLDDFEASLPLDLTFTSTNLAASVGEPTMTVFTTIHTLFSLCQIVLHREYIPFVPLRCDRPVGPLDEPTFPKEKYDVPDGFWDESAEHLFKAARDIVEIVRANSRRLYLIESPLVGFAIWTAAFVGVYSCNFPHMDRAGYMNGTESSIDSGDSGEILKGATSLAVRSLAQMSPKLKMASGWSTTIERMHAYFTGIIKDYARNRSQGNKSSSVAGAAELSLREGGRGGGLEEYKVVEPHLKEFTSIEEDERHSTPTTSERTASRASTSGPVMTPSIKAETMQGPERAPPGRPGSEGTWAAVNNNAPTGTDDFGRRSSYLYSASQPLVNSTHDAVYYNPQQQRSSKLPTSNAPSHIGATPNSVELDPSYRIDHIVASEPYSQASRQLLAGYPSSAQHTLPIFPETELPLWMVDSLTVLGGSKIDGFADGLPWSMWGDQDVTAFMQTLSSPAQPRDHIGTC